MELRHVRTFLAIAEHANFGRAASAMHVAQSAVSQTIRALEEEVGAPLFVRGRRGASLTEAGARFLPRARAVMAELDAGVSDARSASEGTTGRLRLRLGPLFGLTRLPAALARFHRELPGVSLDVAPTARDPLSALDDGSADVVALVANKHDLRGRASALVEASPIHAAVGTRHRHAQRRWVSFADFSHETLLLPEALTSVVARDAFARHARAHRFEPGPVLDVGHLDALLGLVAAGVGVSFLPSLIERMRFRGVVLVPVRASPEARLVLAWNETRPPATVRRLVTMLDEE